VLPGSFEQRPDANVLHNQDNREHDLLDSDDYSISGRSNSSCASLREESQTYFGDHSNPENPRVRQLREEIARVPFSCGQSQVAGVMRHGYKGCV